MGLPLSIKCLYVLLYWLITIMFGCKLMMTPHTHKSTVVIKIVMFVLVCLVSVICSIETLFGIFK